MINGQATCVIGTSANSLYPYSTMSFFLNTKDPALCNGNITTFQFCYYTINTDRNTEYSSQFAVYRPIKLPDDSISYSVLSRQLKVIRNATSLNLSQDQEQMVCSNVSFNVPVSVQVGDVLGACLFSESTPAQLQIVGNTTNSQDYLMLADGNIFCVNSSLPSSVTSPTRVNSLVLHLYADIVPIGTEIGAGSIIGILIGVFTVTVVATIFVTVVLWQWVKRRHLHEALSTERLYTGTPGFGKYL